MKENAASMDGKNAANCAWYAALYPSILPSPDRTPMVDTIPSFATKPDREDATACHVPNPSGLKMNAIAPPITASSESSASTRPKFPPAKPKLPRNHITAQQRNRMVPAFFRNAHTLSHTLRSTPFGDGAWYAGSSITNGAGSPSNIFVFFKIMQYTITSPMPRKYIAGATHHAPPAM